MRKPEFSGFMDTSVGRLPIFLVKWMGLAGEFPQDCKSWGCRDKDFLLMLTVDNLYKSFEGKPLLHGVSFQVGAGETLCLLGPSGSGKSTILRVIAGLEEADLGRVLWDGTDLAGQPAYRRCFGLMFQDYALFPHRSVAENIAFGLRMQNLPRAEVDRQVDEALARVDLTGFARRRVTDLSGGEQQRVALARALAPQPRLLMLDEPLAALDRTLREQLGEELRRILHETGIPAIYVTHDQEEAFAIADRLILLHDGQVAQSGAPAEVYTRPASAWVAGFFGLGNLVHGRVENIAPVRVQTALGCFEPDCPPGDFQRGDPVTLLLRPTGAAPAGAEDPQAANLVSGVVRDAFFQGDSFRLRLQTDAGPELTFSLAQSQAPGQALRLHLDPENILCLP
jgi:ABC-type Fe3+/spermidine/putrescine transport system ATPase subunit